MKQVPDAFNKIHGQNLAIFWEINLKTFASSLHGPSSWNKFFEVKFRDAGWLKNIWKMTLSCP